MTGLQLLQADDLYQAAGSARVERHSIVHPVVSRYSTRLVRLYRSLGEEAEDPFWSGVLHQLFLARMNLCAVPLPFDHPSVLTPEAEEFLGTSARRCQLIYPDRAAALDELMSLFRELQALGQNPLYAPIEERLQPGTRGAVLVRSARYVRLVEDFVAGTPLQELRILTVPRLRGESCLDQLFVLGPSAWLPTFVVTAPRARQVHLLHYSCIRDDFLPEPVFHQVPGARPPRLATIREQQELSAMAEETVSARELGETALWVLPVAQGVSQAGDETVPAHLFLLDEEWAVFLEERSSVLIIDLEEEEGQLQRVQVEEVVPGQFLLLRTERGGDHVASIADYLLGESAAAYRDLQQEWKTRLRAAVEASSLIEVSIALLELGSICADEANVRNWCSSRSIKTHDRRDFAAIMRLIGWGDREPVIWETMEEIDSAHRRAGALIRQRLLNQVLQADLSLLEHAGRMDFELPEAEGGAITALRVEDRLSETVSIAISRIGQPFDQEGRPWHA